MDKVTIRQYKTSDLEQCRALWIELTQYHQEIYSDPTIGGDSPGLDFDSHLARVGVERVWIAERAEEVVGFVGLVADDREAEVEPIVVRSEHRGKGIGRALLEHVIEEAKKLEVRYLSVKPVARNTDAISFYYDAGFQILGQIEMFMDLEEDISGNWKPGPVLFEHSFRY